jgi:hypothetical protein
MVVTKLRAAVMASADGFCAAAGQIDNRNMLVMINERLNMIFLR